MGDPDVTSWLPLALSLLSLSVVSLINTLREANRRKFESMQEAERRGLDLQRRKFDFVYQSTESYQMLTGDTAALGKYPVENEAMYQNKLARCIISADDHHNLV